MNDQPKYNRIKATLALKGKQNKDLAEYMKVSEQTSSKWSTNLRQPSIPELYQIAAFLGVTVCELLETKPILPEPSKGRTEKGE